MKRIITSLILTNFLTNATKHTEKGYICFGYEFIKTRQARFYIKDSGEGIPEEKLEHIIDKTLFNNRP